MNFENMLRYCRELELNNNRPWFHANHKQYEVAKAEFTELVDRMKYIIAERADLELQERIMFANPRDMLYRIPRDARVYKNKPPYNPTWRAYISGDKKALLPLGYYVMIAPGNVSEFGSGAWCPDSDCVNNVRNYIAENWEELDELLAESGLCIWGDKLKRCPQGYDPEHPAVEYLKYKNWLFLDQFKDEQLTDADAFLDIIADRVERMEPLRRYFNRAMRNRPESMWERLNK